MRAALEIPSGGTLAIEIDGGCARMISLDRAIREVEALVRAHVPEGISLADELLAERRAEAERE